jgi:hypothetical protein
MKEITNVTSEGLTYIDDEGNPRFIDFETCLQNYMVRWEKDGITDEAKAFWRKVKNVGIRFSFREPPLIVFYTEPRVYFEFPTKADFYKVLSMIKRAGWRTNDGE